MVYKLKGRCLNLSMNAKQYRFVQEYCIDWNGTQAAIRAGYSPDSAKTTASDLLTYPDVIKAVEERKEAIAAVAELDAAWVLKQWKQIASADPTELIQVLRVNCRHCHGIGHQYQWTEVEYRERLDESIEDNRPAPNGMGGFGFDPKAPPVEDCPECGGLGEPVIVLSDTRHLAGSARRLYAGVRKTKDGIEVKMRDQDAALANIAKYLGMLIDKKELSGPNGKPLAIANLSAEDLTDDQLAALVAAEESSDDKSD